MGRGFAGQRNAITRCHHVHQRVSADIETMDMRGPRPLDQAVNDVIEHLGA